jgi:hypothetical protein
MGLSMGKVRQHAGGREARLCSTQHRHAAGNRCGRAMQLMHIPYPMPLELPVCRIPLQVAHTGTPRTSSRIQLT